MAITLKRLPAKSGQRLGAKAEMGQQVTQARALRRRWLDRVQQGQDFGARGRAQIGQRFPIETDQTEFDPLHGISLATAVQPPLVLQRVHGGAAAVTGRRGQHQGVDIRFLSRFLRQWLLAVGKKVRRRAVTVVSGGQGDVAVARQHQGLALAVDSQAGRYLHPFGRNHAYFQAIDNAAAGGLTQLPVLLPVGRLFVAQIGGCQETAVKKVHILNAALQNGAVQVCHGSTPGKNKGANIFQQPGTDTRYPR